MAVPRKEFKNMLCMHNLASTGAYGKTMRSIVFMDADGSTYIWVTTAGIEYTEGMRYDISACYNERNILSYVKLIKDYGEELDLKLDDPETESEQPDHSSVKPVDVFDLIFDTSDTHLTND